MIHINLKYDNRTRSKCHKSPIELRPFVECKTKIEVKAWTCIKCGHPLSGDDIEAGKPIYSVTLRGEIFSNFS